MCSPCESGLSEQATLYICPPRGSRTTEPQLSSIPVAVASLLHHLAGATVWRWNGSLSDICWLRLFFWEEPLFRCEGDGPWLMV